MSHIGGVLSIVLVQSSLYKYYPYKRYNFMYVKKILHPYKNTIGKIASFMC